MTLEQVKELHNGDEVFWNDPGGEDWGEDCSRHLTIHTVEIMEDDGAGGPWVKITDKSGDYIECYIKELS